MIKKLLKNLVVFLMIGAILLSNLPYWALTKALDSYIAAANIVDKSWHLSQDGNVVDKFTSYRNVIEKFKINEAHAATLTYVGGAEASGNSANYSVSLTGLTGGAGSAAAANDLVIVATGSTGTANLDPGVTTAGYTEEVAGVDLWANDTNDANFSVNWKVMGGTPDTSVTCKGSGTSTVGAVCVVQVWRNASTTTPMDVTATTATAINGTLFNSPSITPVTSGAVVISAGLAGMGAVDTSITAPTGYGNQVDISVDPGTAATVGIASKAWSGSGAEDPAAWTNITTSTSDSWAAYTLAIRPANDPPTITVDNPPTGNTNLAEGSSYNIQYDLADADSTATVDFYYETDGNGVGGTAIAACQDQVEGTDATCSFSTNILTVSTAYYIYGEASDGTNTVVDVSSGTITVNDAPTLTVTEPDGTGDSVTQGSSYTIHYDLADTDSTVTVDLYYDTDGSGLDGTAITGCTNLVEGTDQTCAWDTTGVALDTYFIYGRDVSDGVNAEVTDYSPGEVTITASTVVTVNETGTQSSPLIIPSTGNYIGGAFTMIRGTGTANVTSITITESGTVDASTNLDNIKLQYDLDTTAPYDCASVSYGAGDTQYGSTDTDGFSAANGTSTFTGSVAVSDVQAMCVYVVLDVGSGTSDGQTMIVRITNPSTDVVVSAGTVDPSTAQGAGTTTLETEKITVATEGTQANMIIGTGDNNVGGAFSFTRNTASTDVTSITITDTGTVNANSNISDVRVYYKQEGTCSSTIPVDATLFNSSAGSFNGSEKSTVTGTMSVGTSKICVYVRVDAGDAASDAQTLEIEISNPSSEVTASAGSVSPATAVAISGTTTLNLPTYTSLGIPFLYTANNWGTGGSGVSFYLEVYMRQTTGTVYARLLNETDNTAVSGSTLSTTSSSFTRVRSVALSLTDGKTYRVQFGKIGSDAGKTMGGKLVVNQNGAGGGGADLAEFYSSSDSLDLAEVVTIDHSKAASVKRSNKPYQGDILGVVATQPGIILGENVGQSYPIALVGRVPVKVTTENGIIKSGDYLTSSSVPGHAMKATKAGRVLGQALEALDESKLQDCPSDATKKCGTVVVFVNLIDYLGSPVELVMEENKSQEVLGLQENEATTSAFISSKDQVNTPSSFKELPRKDQEILSFLRDLKVRGSGVNSQVFTDRVAAGEIISPTIITDILYAKKIKADSIEGFEVLTDRVSSLSNKIAGIATPSATVTAKSIPEESNFAKLDLEVLSKLFAQAKEFVNNIIFHGDISFLGRPTFNKDTAGFAVIKKDTNKVEIIFDKEYAAVPLVNISITLDDQGDSEDQIKTREELEEKILSGDIRYIVTKRTNKGFIIKLNKNVPEDLKFSWSALAVKDAKISINSQPPVINAPVVESIPQPTPESTPEASVSAEVVN